MRVWTKQLMLLMLLMLCGSAVAQTSDDVQAIRAEMEAMRAHYEARLSALEARLDAAERPSSTMLQDVPLTSVPRTSTSRTVTTSSDSITAGSAFNPQISLILDGNYYHDDLSGAGFGVVGEAWQPSHLAHESGEPDEHHDHGGVGNGFNLRETELAISATVDPYFDAGAYIAFDEEGSAEVEEAWFQTRALPYGLKLKGGRFFSDFGYINKQHPHQWDFADQSLPYLNLLGDHGLRDDGIQLTWVPDAPIYTLIGVEVLQGEQERFGSVVEDDEVRTDVGLQDEKSGPRLFTGFLKLGPDLGYDHALQLGVSFAHSRQQQNADLAAQGDADLWGVDVVYKYDNPGAWGVRDIELQAEYLRATQDLSVVGGDNAGASLDLTTDGYYLQGNYGIAPRWQMGLRYDVLGGINRVRGQSRADYGQSDRWSAALTWVPSEFSLLRLQYARNDILLEPGERDRFDTIWLQFLMSLGAHGQHRF